uniref:Uncharacterized protein n=1 Tax=Anguilla anguilla TaxID=7936 RepID=A0A0E9PA91_ANGAN
MDQVTLLLYYNSMQHKTCKTLTGTHFGVFQKTVYFSRWHKCYSNNNI